MRLDQLTDDEYNVKTMKKIGVLHVDIEPKVYYLPTNRSRRFPTLL